MKGIVFAVLAGGFITLQGIANARIGEQIGVWQTAALTQLTGFIGALALLLLARGGDWRSLARVRPLYLAGGTLGAVIVFSNVTAIQQAGATLTVSIMLIAQLCATFAIDRRGWFGVTKQRMGPPQYAGLGLMIAGVVLMVG